MIAVLTQNKAIINLDNTTTISVVKDDNNKIVIVADQTYILGYYNNESDATSIIIQMAEFLGNSTESNVCFMMPYAHEVSTSTEDKNNAEND